MLAQAVLDLFPDATFGIGPPVEDGFYYDFELPGGATFTPEDLDRIDARMREIIDEHQAFVREEIPADDARKIFEEHRFKLEIIDNASTDPMSATSAAGSVRTYENPPASPRSTPPFAGQPGFIDLCRGPHVEHTGRHLGHFKLLRVAGAYWRGDEHNPQLQRIYGTAWDSRKALEAHLHHLEEAAKRDHRKLGAELDLFSFPSEVGSGLPLYHPKGGLVRKLMEDYSRAEHEKAGYEFVFTPHLAKEDLYKISGHLEWYADGMYPPMELDEGHPVLPEAHELPHAHPDLPVAQRSYRELPLRLFEFGMVYRYEKSGVVHGLLRARGFTQDDSHIFCTPEQLPAELTSLLGSCCGCCATTASTSSRPSWPPGPTSSWATPTTGTRPRRRCGRGRGGRHPLRGGRGRGRLLRPQDRRPRAGRHRPALAAVDHPGRLPVPAALRPRVRGRRQPAPPAPDDPPGAVRVVRPVLRRAAGAHRGALPVWLAPVQVQVLPVRSDHQAYGDELVERLRAEGFRAEAVEADEPLGARIRKAKLEKMPPRRGGGRRRRGRRHRGRQPAGRRGRAGRAGGRLRRAAARPRSPPTA